MPAELHPGGGDSAPSADPTRSERAESASLRIESVRSEAAWRHAASVREEVFVQEQRCPPHEEWDAFDEVSRHFVGYLELEPVATARWRTATVDGEAVAKLERFAVRSAYRRRGYGRRMVAFVLEDAWRAGFRTFYVHAQAHVASMYAAFGFEQVGEPFDEVGIPHVAMILRDPGVPTRDIIQPSDSVPHPRSPD